MTARLSTCGRCRGTIEQYLSPTYRQLRWRHVAPTPDGHIPDPDDSAVAEPDRDCCDTSTDSPCDPACGCAGCEVERALDEDADAWADR